MRAGKRANPPDVVCEDMRIFCVKLGQHMKLKPPRRRYRRNKRTCSTYQDVLLRAAERAMPQYRQRSPIRYLYLSTPNTNFARNQCPCNTNTASRSLRKASHIHATPSRRAIAPVIEEPQALPTSIALIAVNHMPSSVSIIPPGMNEAREVKLLWEKCSRTLSKRCDGRKARNFGVWSASCENVIQTHHVGKPVYPHDYFGW